MAKNKHLKRKPAPVVKEKQNEIATVETDEESASDQEVNTECVSIKFVIDLFSKRIFCQEFSLNDVNNDGDSSDSENENDDQVQSSDDELSFESDDEGNFQQNFNKKYHAGAESGSEDDEDEKIDEEASENELNDDEDEEEDVDDEEEEVYSSDDSDELSFEEEDSVHEDEPSTSASTSNKKPTSVKQNGTTKQNSKSNSVNKTQETGNLLRVKKSEANAVEAFKNELNKSDGTSVKNGAGAEDEYEKHDTDDEEDIRNTIGNIPMHWYDEYKHIGYDWDAKKIIKPTKRDQLDDFLKRMEDPNFWRTVKDPQTGQDVVLSEADIDLIKRINSQRIPDANFDDYTVRIWHNSKKFQFIFV